MFGLTGVIVGGTSVVALGGLLATGYVKAPTDKAYIISGLRKEPRVVIGKATIKVLTKTEREELRECLNRACELVRESYIRFYRRI